MKYMHGTDEKKHDLMLIGTIRFFIVVFFFAVLFFLVILYEYLSFLFSVGFSAENVLVLIPVIMGVVAFPFGIFDCVWRSGRYQLSKDGITIKYPFRTRLFSWDNILRVFICPIYSGDRALVQHDYILVVLSECNLNWGAFSLRVCRKNRARFLAIRATEARISEFEMFMNGTRDISLARVLNS